MAEEPADVIEVGRLFHTHIHSYIHTHTYIYIYRERERERERLHDEQCSASDRSSLRRGNRITQAERRVAWVIWLRDVNETDLIQNSASRVTYLSNHWSLKLLMQDFYQLIHEDCLTCA